MGQAKGLGRKEVDGPGQGPQPFGHPPASLRSCLEVEAMDVRARVGGGALVPTYHLLVQPWAEWDAGHLGVGALQVGSWRGRR